MMSSISHTNIIFVRYYVYIYIYDQTLVNYFYSILILSIRLLSQVNETLALINSLCLYIILNNALFILFTHVRTLYVNLRYNTVVSIRSFESKIALYSQIQLAECAFTINTVLVFHQTIFSRIYQK